MLEAKMKERGFTVYAQLSPDNKEYSKTHFVSADMFSFDRTGTTPLINIIVTPSTEEFECFYNIPGSVNILKTPKCGSVMNDEHFDRIVGVLEVQAKWLARISS